MPLEKQAVKDGNRWEIWNDYTLPMTWKFSADRLVTLEQSWAFQLFLRSYILIDWHKSSEIVFDVKEFPFQGE